MGGATWIYHPQPFGTIEVPLIEVELFPLMHDDRIALFDDCGIVDADVQPVWGHHGNDGGSKLATSRRIQPGIERLSLIHI